MLQNLKIKTVDNESISINNVDYIGLDDAPLEHTPIKYNQILINSSRGLNRFELEKIKSIEFSIVGEKHVVTITSTYKDETKKGK